MMQTLKRNWLAFSKLTWDIWRIVTQALKNFKSLHFNGLLLNKVSNFWAKKVPKSHFSWHWRGMKNLKITDLWFGKSHEEFTKFLPEHLRVPKLGLWWDIFIQNLKMYDYMCHDYKEWYKVWRGVDLPFQNWNEEFS